MDSLSLISLREMVRFHPPRLNTCGFIKAKRFEVWSLDFSLVGELVTQLQLRLSTCIQISIAVIMWVRVPHRTLMVWAGIVRLSWNLTCYTNMPKPFILPNRLMAGQPALNRFAEVRVIFGQLFYTVAIVQWQNARL